MSTDDNQPPEEWDAFLSYHNRDKRLAIKIQRALERLQAKLLLRDSPIRVFRDESDLGASSDLSESLKSEIRQSHCIVLLLTRNTGKSTWVRQELEYNNGLTCPKPRPVIVAYQGGSWEELSAPVQDLFRRASDTFLPPRAVQIHSPFWAEQLAAGILGIGLDKLINRARRDRRRRIVTLATIVAVFLLSVIAATSRFDGRRRTITTAEPTQITDLTFHGGRLNLQYAVKMNEQFLSETAFSIPIWRGAAPIGLGVPKTRFSGADGTLALRNPSACILVLKGHNANVWDSTAQATLSTRVLPAQYGDRGNTFLGGGALRLPLPLCVDHSGLPTSFVDVQGGIWVHDKTDWHRVETGGKFSGMNVMSICAHPSQPAWVMATSNGVFVVDADGTVGEAILAFTAASNYPSAVVGSNGLVTWITGEMNSTAMVADATAPSRQPIMLENPLERYPESGGVHTQSNFFSRLKFSEGGRFVLGLSSSNRISIWDSATGKLVLHLKDAGFNAITAADISEDGRHLALAEWNGYVQLFRRVLVFGGNDAIDLPLWYGASWEMVNVP